MDITLVERMERDLRHLRAAIEAGDVSVALPVAKRVRRIATLSVQDIANTRDALHALEGDKP